MSTVATYKNPGIRIAVIESEPLRFAGFAVSVRFGTRLRGERHLAGRI